MLPTADDLAFAAYCDTLGAEIDTTLILAFMQLAYAQGRGSALAEAARVPAPSSSADRHARYSAGIREPAPARESAADRRAREQARAWGFC